MTPPAIQPFHLACSPTSLGPSFLWSYRRSQASEVFTPTSSSDLGFPKLCQAGSRTVIDLPHPYVCARPTGQLTDRSMWMNLSQKPLNHQMLSPVLAK
ncbi:hypothetical protein NQZ68_025563 [Dissostichus eleginoides]|nr:hypothetical protein NQZ68_025563 [Dissostichus eleginoides]